jgi:2-polyprenyl-6-methoxyphenol hydroxylase-like FAD-dependent oxidoreductase
VVAAQPLLRSTESCTAGYTSECSDPATTFGGPAEVRRTDHMTTRAALISGAGIAGPVLAFWLAEAGWDVTVVESAGRLRTSGYPVDLRGKAIDVVRRMGVFDEILAQRYEHVPITVLSKRGSRIGTMKLGQSDSAENDAEVEIGRGVLSEILHRASRDRAHYVFGDSIAALNQTDTGVDVTFGRRPPQKFDTVIGADGLHSNVRRLAFGEESRFIRHLGSYAAVWDLPDTDMFASGAGYVYSHPGRSVVIERAADGATTRAFLTFGHAAPGTVNRHDADEVVHIVRSAFAEDRWRSGEIIDTLVDADDLYFDTVSQIRMDCWSTGRIALVGDAAYAPAFLSSRSTSIAITGAWTLATALADSEVPEHAFAAYERQLRRCVEKTQDRALRRRDPAC